MRKIMMGQFIQKSGDEEVFDYSVSKNFGINDESDKENIKISASEVYEIASKAIFIGIANIIIGFIIIISDVLASLFLYKKGIFGFLQGMTLGMLSFSGIIIGMGIYLVAKGIKYRKNI